MQKRTVSGIMLTLVLIGMLTLAFNIRPVKAGIITVPDDYPTIQEAINNADEEDTIYVKPGTYYESFVVNKSVSLIGEAKTTTIIEGSGYMDTVVTVEANNCTLSGFTVQNGFWGITLYSSNGSHITNNIVRSNVINGVLGDHASHNKVTHNIFSHNLGAVYLSASDYNLIANNGVDRWNDGGVGLAFGSDHNWIVNNTLVESGISIHHSDNNTVTNNRVTNCWSGIILEGARFNDLLYNNVSGCWGGIALDHAGVNKIVGNILRYNGHGIHMFPWSWYNTIYHNNLVENTLQAVIEDWSLYNSWNNSCPSGGNYWSDYAGVDDYSGPYQNITGSDGIGDTPYVIDANNRDNYPLMAPWTPLPRTIGGLKTKIEEQSSQGEIDNHGIVKSLLAKLNVAQKLVDKGKIDEAKSILEEDFITQVQNLSGIHITPEAADILIQSAEYIVSHL